MDKRDILERINTAAIHLLESRTLELLCKEIVEEAKALVEVEYGTLFLTTNGRLEKVYTSSERIKKLSTTIKRFLQRPLHTKEVAVLDTTILEQKFPEAKKEDIHSIIILPLSHKNDITGILVLFSKNVKHFTPEQIKILKLYASMINLAITKTQVNEESIRALQMRDRFISLASHELRTPLTSINGYIQLLHSRLAKVGTVESRWIKELYIESLRMTNLVKELLDVNRIKQGQLAFVFSEVSMREIVENAIQRFEIMHPDYPIHFEDKTQGKKVTIIGDYDKLLEMIAGLLGNAIKFSRPQVPVVVILTTTGRTVHVSIKDQGKGISKQDLAAIFDGFYKGDHPNHKEGMGVGLLLAKHIITYHRGKIRIKSKENGGTTVEVILPSIKLEQ